MGTLHLGVSLNSALFPANCGHSFCDFLLMVWKTILNSPGKLHDFFPVRFMGNLYRHNLEGILWWRPCIDATQRVSYGGNHVETQPRGYLMVGNL